jgi:hypothetical protein
MLSGITKLAFLCGYATVFLHAAGIGEEHARGLFEGDDVEIAYGINKLRRVRQYRLEGLQSCLKT